jgi:hypothetical protein
MRICAVDGIELHELSNNRRNSSYFAVSQVPAEVEL